MTGTLPPRRVRRLLVPSLVTLALVAGACTTGSGTGSSRSSYPPSDQVTPAPVLELTSIDTLRDAFNDEGGSTRLILLVSPT